MAPVIASLRALVQACAAGLAGVPAKKREMEDNSKRVGGLFWRLNARQVSAPVCAALGQLAAALDAGDLATASQIQARAHQRLRLFSGSEHPFRRAPLLAGLQQLQHASMLVWRQLIACAAGSERACKVSNVTDQLVQGPLV